MSVISYLSSNLSLSYKIYFAKRQTLNSLFYYSIHEICYCLFNKRES